MVDAEKERVRAMIAREKQKEGRRLHLVRVVGRREAVSAGMLDHSK